MIYKKIESKSNPLIADTAKLSLKKYRDSKQMFFTEGKKLAKEAALAGISPIYVLYSEEFADDNVNFCREIEEYFNNDTEYFVTKIENLRKISGETAPEGIVCVFKHIDKIKKIDKINTSMSEKMPHKTDGSAVVLESLRDPGNLGTVIRSALAFEIGELFVSPDCANLYSLKTLRGSMGAVFRQCITVCDSADAIEYLRNTGRRVYAAALHDKARLLGQFDIDGNTAFVIGNEANGLRNETVSACDGCVLIPMGRYSESLNASVAASVLMWELAKNK